VQAVAMRLSSTTLQPVDRVKARRFAATRMIQFVHRRTRSCKALSSMSRLRQNVTVLEPNAARDIGRTQPR
jgi:hypothetical protein